MWCSNLHFSKCDQSTGLHMAYVYDSWQVLFINLQANCECPTKMYSYTDANFFLICRIGQIPNIASTFVDGCEPPIKDWMGSTPLTGLPPPDALAPPPGEGGSDGVRE